MHIGILVFAGADELDVVGPHRVFAALNDIPGASPIDVHLVAERPGRILLAHGLAIDATNTFGDCPRLDVLVVPGGGSEGPAGRRAQQRNANAIGFIRDRSREARVSASVCTGAFLLAEAGVLAGRRANTHWRYRDELAGRMKGRGEHIDIVPERVVWDGDDLVTGGGVTSGIDVALSIVGRLAGERTRRMIEVALELETPVTVPRSSPPPT